MIKKKRKRNKDIPFMRSERKPGIAAAAACLICAILVSGCLHQRVRSTGIGPQAKVMENKKYRVLGESEGQSSSFNLLWFIPVTLRLDYDRAVNDAISKMNGDNLIEVRTWKEVQIWIVGMVEILHVKGKVIQYERK
jgi:hypothetical protein